MTERDLFGTPGALPDDPFGEAAADAPLADRMRPRSAEEFHGQRTLVGEGKILSRALAGELVGSLILWGPPGSGKTTLARLIAKASGMRFVPFSAVLSGVKEIRKVMAEAEADRRSNQGRTLLFVDEIHRFNKAQQDAFLPFVERGDILLIGATTENPSFEVNGALLSRLKVMVLEPLSAADVVDLMRRALVDPERGLRAQWTATDDVLNAIAHATDGDARRALTALETAAALRPGGGELDRALVEEALQRKMLHHDKSGEEHYNLISALHKSVRNSDEDASLYWIARLMEAGEDGNYLSRRMIRMASEDVGLADPFALRITLDAAEAFARLGYPEGKLALAQAAVYLARAKKSNAVYTALGRAEQDVHETAAEPVPKQLRNAVTALMRAAGYGEGYRYAHDDPDAVGEMTCLPPSLEGRRYFESDAPGGD
ncbi:MAG: replication-associated recombination protein A [Planctomycetota bacterium]|jgi:putative ATPase|nr:replication-associated recombination protein A [Planctomycetota bacterium]MDP6762051.1 replication-associated recombination protein A [Planctomycetota bacterium]MDP6989150.1 replication-associated recombination protein A [Planctomycetota bacterium]